MTKRKCYTAEFKAKVALEAIREELTDGRAGQEIRHSSDNDQRLEENGNREHGIRV